MPTVSAERLAEVFVEVADTLVDDFDLVEFLQLVCARSAELIGTGAVGLLLADEQGELQLMAASDEAATLLEQFEVHQREGPGLDAFHGGAPTFVPDLAAEAQRWPQFVPQALALGFVSVHALPMRLREEGIGVLSLCSRSAGGLDPRVLRVVQALVDVATIGLLQERAIRQGKVLTDQLQGALNSRIVIEQAKGVLAQLHRVSVDEAFTLMRTYARRNGRRLSEVAHAVVSGDRSGVGALTGE